MKHYKGILTWRQFPKTTLTVITVPMYHMHKVWTRPSPLTPRLQIRVWCITAVRSVYFFQSSPITESIPANWMSRSLIQDVTWRNQTIKHWVWLRHPSRALAPSKDHTAQKLRCSCSHTCKLMHLIITFRRWQLSCGCHCLTPGKVNKAQRQIL